MAIIIKCPDCNSEGSLSLVDPNYRGPYKCWKCKALFTIEIEDNELKSCNPLSQEDFEQQQEINDLKNKFKQSS